MSLDTRRVATGAEDARRAPTLVTLATAPHVGAGAAATAPAFTAPRHRAERYSVAGPDHVRHGRSLCLSALARDGDGVPGLGGSGDADAPRSIP